jgi:hypothetical protein
MEWNVWVIKPFVITTRQLSYGSQVGKGTFPPSTLQKFQFLSVEILLF